MNVGHCAYIWVGVDDGLVAGLASVGSQQVVQAVAAVDAGVVALQTIPAVDCS